MAGVWLSFEVSSGWKEGEPDSAASEWTGTGGFVPRAEHS